MKRFALFVLLLAFPLVCMADECRDCKCEHCGCESHCQKWCHVICEWKDVKETVYSYKCTDVCIPGCSEKLCTKCDECGPNNCGLFHDYKPLYSIWCPSDCARIRSVSKLVKTEVTHKVPTYRWVVEYCCDHCRSCDENCTSTTNDSMHPPEPPPSNPPPKPAGMATAFSQTIGSANPWAAR